MYYSDQFTDEQLKKLENRIKRMYNRAYLEMKDTAEEYFIKFADRYEKEYEAYQKGAYTDAQFKAWVQTQIARGKGYEAFRDELAQKMTDANKIASAYVNDATPSIYSLNRDYEAYRIEEGLNIDFHMQNEMTVRRLANFDNHIEFKTTGINQKKDYEWNRKQIHSALVAGILQGKSIDKLADSYMVVMKRNRASAIRNARTSFTSAQNAGRLESFYRADAMGINLKKKWIATYDERTRTSHEHLNGQIVDFDKTFSNGLRYPADVNGAPAEVYNCRCAMRTVLPNINENKIAIDFEKNRKNLPMFRNGGEDEESDTDYTDYGTLNRTLLLNNVEYKQVKKLKENLTKEEIIKKLAKKDRTAGSCASQALAYIGNKAGYDVTDYKGGVGCDIFADRKAILEIANYKGVKSYVEKSNNDIQAVNSLLKNVNNKKEYLLATAEHVAIVYRENAVNYFLDLQGRFNTQRELTDKRLQTRFGCDDNREIELENVLIDIETLYNNSKFINILGYINTKD